MQQDEIGLARNYCWRGETVRMVWAAPGMKARRRRSGSGMSHSPGSGNSVVYLSCSIAKLAVTSDKGICEINR